MDCIFFRPSSAGRVCAETHGLFSTGSQNSEPVRISESVAPSQVILPCQSGGPVGLSQTDTPQPSVAAPTQASVSGTSRLAGLSQTGTPQPSVVTRTQASGTSRPAGLSQTGTPQPSVAAHTQASGTSRPAGLPQTGTPQPLVGPTQASVPSASSGPAGPSQATTTSTGNHQEHGYSR